MVREAPAPQRRQAPLLFNPCSTSGETSPTGLRLGERSEQLPGVGGEAPAGPHQLGERERGARANRPVARRRRVR